MEWNVIRPLTNAAIDEISGKAEEFLTELNTEPKNLLRIRLILEEILLGWQSVFSSEAPCRIRLDKRLGRPYLQLELEGKPCNPLEQDTEEYGAYRGRLLANMGLSPLYSYENGKNKIIFKLKKQKTNPLLSLALAAAAAIVVGFAGLLLPEASRTAMLDQLLRPLYEAFFNMLGTVAGPMVFLSVAWGICGIGDAATFGRIGKRMLLHFLKLFSLIGILACLLGLPFFSLRFAQQSGGAAQLDSLLQMVLDFVPSNIVTPFQTGNTLQIILLAVVVGCALLILSRQVEQVTRFVEQLNYVVQFLMELISKLLPGFIFIVLVQMIWSGSLGVVFRAWKLVLVFLLLNMLLLAGLTGWTALQVKASPLLIIKKALPAFVIAFTTASSVAAFGTCVNSCEKKMGIPSQLTGFGLPIGMVLFRTGSVVNNILVCLYAAETASVECALIWFVLAVFTSIVLSIASPPIPGGALTCYTILFSQLGLPEEILVVVLALDLVFDFVITGVNVYSLQLEMLLQAKRWKMLDDAVLRKE